VTESAVTTEVHESLDALLYFATGIALDLVPSFDRVAEALDLGVAQIVHLLVDGDASLCANLKGRRMADAVDVREGVSDLLTTREIDSRNTCHNLSLALTLLVAWVFANDPNNALATDHLTLLTNLLDAWSYLHG
jgi:hypothetical protein